MASARGATDVVRTADGPAAWARTGPGTGGGGLALGLAAGLAGLAVAHGAPGLAAIGPLRLRFLPRLAGYGRPGHVALTLDDGPDPEWTPAFLGLLAARHVRATFFLLGSMVAKEPGLAAQIAAAGHEIGVHGYDHRYGVLRSPRSLSDDLARARDTIAAAAGATPAFYRPPYGVLTSATLLASRRLGLAPVLWTNWGREWKSGATPESVYRCVVADLAGGSCVLLHDSDCSSPPGAAAAALGALPRLLDECERRGLRVGTLGEHGIRV